MRTSVGVAGTIRVVADCSQRRHAVSGKSIIG